MQIQPLGSNPEIQPTSSHPARPESYVGGTAALEAEQPAPVIGAIEKFEDIFYESVLLLERASSQNLFSHPAWIRAYLKAFEPAADVIVITARQQGRLTGVLPLIRKLGRLHGVPVRFLRAPANSHCHSFEVLREKGVSGQAALNVIWATLRTIDGWDVMELPRMPAGGTASELIALAKEDGWLAAQGSPAANLSITIRPGVGESKDAPWQASASSGLRKDLRRAARLVESELGCELRLETIPRPTAEQLIRFYRLECLGWKGTERSAIISAPQTQQFYSEIAGIFADSGRFTLNFLYFGTHIAAGQIGVLTGDSFCGLKLTYDEDFARYSPGSLLLNELLGACWRNGTCQLQLGPDGSYKRRWTSQESPVGSCFIFRRGLYGRLLHTGKFAAAPRVKRAIAFLGRRFRSGI